MKISRSLTESSKKIDRQMKGSTYSLIQSKTDNFEENHPDIRKVTFRRNLSTVSWTNILTLSVIISQLFICPVYSASCGNGFPQAFCDCVGKGWPFKTCASQFHKRGSPLLDTFESPLPPQVQQQVYHPQFISPNTEQKRSYNPFRPPQMAHLTQIDSNVNNDQNKVNNNYVNNQKWANLLAQRQTRGFAGQPINQFYQPQDQSQYIFY